MTSDNNNHDEVAKSASKANKIATLALFVAIFAAALSMAALMKPFY